MFVGGVCTGIFLMSVALYYLISWLNENPKQGNPHG